MKKLLISILLVFLLTPVMELAYSAESVQVAAYYQPYEVAGYRMEFTVTNSTSSLVNAFMVYRGGRSVVWAPAGWYSYADYRHVGWDPADMQYVILPGDSLSGFAFVEDQIPAEYSWWSSGWAGDFTGTAVPTLIPEPCSLLALAGGLGVVGMHFIRRRKWR